MHKRSSRKFVHSSKAKVQDVLLLAMIAVRARHIAFGHSRLRTKDDAGTKQQLDRGGLLKSSLQSWANTRREAVRRQSLINQKGGGGCGTPTTADALITTVTTPPHTHFSPRRRGVETLEGSKPKSCSFANPKRLEKIPKNSSLKRRQIRGRAFFPHFFE